MRRCGSLNLLDHRVVEKGRGRWHTTTVEAASAIPLRGTSRSPCVASRRPIPHSLIGRGRPASELDDVTVGISNICERMTPGTFAAFDDTPAGSNHDCDRVVEAAFIE